MFKNIMKKSPIAVHALRGAYTESAHLIDVIVLNSKREVIASFGDVSSPIYPRSAIKMLQALLIVESGAYEALGLTPKHLALASSSHFGEEIHTDLVQEWLKHLNFSVDQLRCGVQAPYKESARDKLIKNDQAPCRYHNNCSGKHSGILSVCKHKNYETKNYDDYQHPVQQELLNLLSEVYEYDLKQSHYGIDGCGIPTIAVPLFNLALGHINFLKRPASKLILEGIAKYPDLISGEGNFCSEITKITNGNIFAKVGAEGVYTAFSPKHDIFIALKVRDGAGRASQYLCANLLKELGCLDKSELDSLSRFLDPKIKNWEGLKVGSYRIDFHTT